MADTYVQKINGRAIAASEVVPNSPLADKLAEIEGIGAYEVVSLTTGALPVPDVDDPDHKTIYLTKMDSETGEDKYKEWIYTMTDQWEVIGTTSLDLSGYKTKQDAVSDPTASGSGLEFIATAAQDENGEITVTKQTVQDGTTSQKGVVQIAGSIGATVSTENNKAASEKAVRDAINALDYTASNLGRGKTITSLSETDGVISATAQEIQITESQVTNLETDLDNKADKSTTVTNVAYDTTNKQITKTINGTTTTVVTVAQLESDLDLSGKADKVTSATDGNFAGLDSNGNLTDSGKKASDFVQSVKVYNSSTELNNNGSVVIPKATEGTSGSGAYGVVQIDTISI